MNWQLLLNTYLPNLLQMTSNVISIDPQDLPHIWERFYHSDSATLRGGSGLGLALVKEWIEEMGGMVRVESVPGEGSCFTICLPLPQARALIKSEA